MLFNQLKQAQANKGLSTYSLGKELEQEGVCVRGTVRRMLELGRNQQVFEVIDALMKRLDLKIVSTSVKKRSSSARRASTR